LLARRFRAGLPRRLKARRPGGQAIPSGTVAALLRTPARTLLSTFVIAVAGVALSLGLAARWAFSGAVTPWTLRPLTWQGASVDVAAVVLAVLMASFTVADLNSITLRERVAELRTLRAIGWPERELTGLRMRNAVLPGMAGGLAAGAFDLAAGLSVAGAAPLRLIALTGLAAMAGVGISVLAVGIPALFGRSRRSRTMNEFFPS
jgi:ABC-type antimicrobial peptide transport system permease subunit